MLVNNLRSWGKDKHNVQNETIITKALVLFGFNIMYLWLHHFWILAKSLLKEAATVGLSAGLRKTATTVVSSA